VGQTYIGSSASPGYQDVARVAALMNGRPKATGLSLDINPATRSALLGLVATGQMASLLHSGARFHQIGCNGCNGMGQAPGSGVNSLRTVPRNFPGRSGTVDDKVWLCGPETAAAAALTGEITDPRDIDGVGPDAAEFPPRSDVTRLVPPGNGPAGGIQRGPNIARLRLNAPVLGRQTLPILLRLGDNISTDAISPAGVEALALRSDPDKLADFTFRRTDPEYVARARATADGHVIVAGHNMGQGSSREHATLCPRLLGLKAVLALSFARIFHANLINAGILPLVITPEMQDALAATDQVTLDFDKIRPGCDVEVKAGTQTLQLAHQLTARDCETLQLGGLLARLSAKST
jgi:aconitate hydratase